MKWTTRKIIAAVSLGAITIILSLPGMSLNVIIGTGFGGVINAFIGVMMLVVSILVFKTFGAATLVYLTYGVLGLPLPVLGTPGFLPKILIGLLIGLTADVVFLLSRRYERLAAFLAAGSSAVVGGLLVIGFSLAFALPGVEKLVKAFLLPTPVVIMFILAGLFGLLGLFIYKKLENTAVVLRIQKG